MVHGPVDDNELTWELSIGSSKTITESSLRELKLSIRKHEFFIRLLPNHFSTAERRAFESDVYQLADVLGLPAEHVKHELRKIRKFCLDDDCDGDGSSWAGEMEESIEDPQKSSELSTLPSPNSELLLPTELVDRNVFDRSVGRLDTNKASQLANQSEVPVQENGSSQPNAETKSFHLSLQTSKVVHGNPSKRRKSMPTEADDHTTEEFVIRKAKRKRMDQSKVQNIVGSLEKEIQDDQIQNAAEDVPEAQKITDDSMTFENTTKPRNAARKKRKGKGGNISEAKSPNLAHDTLHSLVDQKTDTASKKKEEHQTKSREMTHEPSSESKKPKGRRKPKNSANNTQVPSSTMNSIDADPAPKALVKDLANLPGNLLARKSRRKIGTMPRNEKEISRPSDESAFKVEKEGTEARASPSQDKQSERPATKSNVKKPRGLNGEETSTQTEPKSKEVEGAHPNPESAKLQRRKAKRARRSAERTARMNMNETGTASQRVSPVIADETNEKEPAPKMAKTQTTSETLDFQSPMIQTA